MHYDVALSERSRTSEDIEWATDRDRPALQKAFTLDPVSISPHAVESTQRN